MSQSTDRAISTVNLSDTWLTIGRRTVRRLLVRLAGALRRHQNWSVAWRSLAIALSSGFCLGSFYLLLGLLIMTPPAKAQAEGLLPPPRSSAPICHRTIAFFGKTDQALSRIWRPPLAC